eukprot:3293025-Prymnesium_polylepis.3
MKPESSSDWTRPAFERSGRCAYTHSWSMCTPSLDVTRYTFVVSRAKAGSSPPTGSVTSFGHSRIVMSPSHKSSLYGVSDTL